MTERIISMIGQWASNANTNIPAPPVPGQPYRNPALSSETIALGQRYSSIADSAEWNQLHYLMTGMIQQLEQFGVLPYSPLTNYPLYGKALGLDDGVIYEALQPSGPLSGGAQPTSNSAYWRSFVYGGGRRSLTSDTTIYVRANGNDANDGLTVSTAKATLTAVRAMLFGVDPRGFTVLVDIGAGEFTYTNFYLLQGYGPDNLFIQGAGVTSTFIVGTDDFMYADQAMSDVCFKSLVVQPVGVLRFVRKDGAQASVRLTDARMQAYGQDSIIRLSGTRVEYSGTTTSALFVDMGGSVTCSASTQFVAINNPVFNYFAVSARGGEIHFYECTFSGAATGIKWHAYQGGQITGQGDNTLLSTLLGSTTGSPTNTGFIGAFGVARAGAVVNAGGGIDRSFGTITCTRTAAGTYAITHPLGTSVYIQVSPTITGSSFITVAGGSAPVVYTRNSAGTLADTSFHILIS